MVGLRQYFKDHAYANSEFVDLLTALEKASGRELDAWAKEWLQTSGVNTLVPEFELAERRHLHVVRRPPDRRRRQRDPAPAPPRHRPVRRGGRPPGPSPQRRDRHRGRPHRGRRAGRGEAARPAAAQRRRPHLRQDPPRRAVAGHRRGRPAAARRLAGAGAVLGRGVGHDPRRGDDGVRLRHPGAGQHRDRDRRVRRPGDPELRRGRGQPLLPPVAPRGAPGALGVRRPRAADGRRGRQRPPADLRPRVRRGRRGPSRRSPT